MGGLIMTVRAAHHSVVFYTSVSEGHIATEFDHINGFANYE